MQPSVTLVTANAAADDLTEQEYMEIFLELRAGRSLDAFCKLLDSQYSKAFWSKVERGDTPLTRAARTELRRAVGLSPLRPTVAEVVAAADPDAAVYQIGQQPARVIVLVGVPSTVTLRCTDNAVTTVHTVSRVTPVTRAASNVRVPTGIFTRLNEFRRSAGLSWAALMERALDALTDQADHNDPS